MSEYWVTGDDGKTWWQRDTRTAPGSWMAGSTIGYIPLSVREGNRRKKLGWWIRGRRGALALRIAPWLGGFAQAIERAGRLEDELHSLRVGYDRLNKRRRDEREMRFDLEDQLREDMDRVPVPECPREAEGP